MSRANIIAMNPRDNRVTFQLRNGDQRTYWYTANDFASISSGDDPKGYEGSQTPPTNQQSSEIFGEIADAVIDIGEIL